MDHDVPVGPLDHCQITGSHNLFEAMDLGEQPPCDALLDTPDAPEKVYPLKLNVCPDSGLAQLSHVVAGEEIYPPSYPYRSGISKPLADYQRTFADAIVRVYGAGFAVDIGSNDGTLLTGFKRIGCPTLGVEPTDVAKIAREENGIETVQAFFTEELAKQIARERGKAHIITTTNVFAHMATLGEVCRGIKALLADDGVFISESHYLLDVLNKGQFDTIYHEHIRTYSLKSLCLLFPYYGLEVFDCQRADRYGGNLRVYVGVQGKRPVSQAVRTLLAHEEASGLFDQDEWVAFQAKSWRAIESLSEFLWECKISGRSVAGVSAPGRSAVLLNAAEVGPNLLPYLGELPNSLKLGKYMPGSRIPIVNNERIIREQPDCVVLMAWHYSEPIISRLRKEGYKGDIYAPLPKFQMVSSLDWYPCVSAL